MALIAMPAKFGFRSIAKWGLVRANNTMRSKFTGQRQVIVYPFAVWVLQGKLIEYPEIEAGPIRAFLADLEGQANTFNFPVPGFTGWNNGAWGGGADSDIQARSVAAARATSFTAGIFTWLYPGQHPPVGTLIAKKGDYFTINGELKLVTADALVTSVGAFSEFTLNFKPGLRAAVAVGNAINFYAPYCVMASIDEDAATWGLGPPVKHDFDFNAMEAF